LIHPLITLQNKQKKIFTSILIEVTTNQQWENEEFIMKSIDKEASRGWAFPIPLCWVPLIPGIAVTPIGVAKEYTLNEIMATSFLKTG